MTGRAEPASARASTAAAVLVAANHGTQGFGAVVLALFLPIIRDDLGITLAEAGIISGAALMTYAAFQIPMGHLADRIPPLRLFLVGVVGVNLLTAAIGLMDAFGAVIGAQLLIGVLRAGVFAAGMRAVALALQGRDSWAAAVFVAGGSVANALANLAMPVVGEALGWRGAMLVAAVTSATTVAALAFVIPRAERALPDQRLTAGGRTSLRTILGDPLVISACVIQFARLAITMSLVGWLPTYLLTDREFDLDATGATVAAILVVGGVGALVGGRLTDRFTRPASLIVVSTAVATATLLLSPLLAGATLITVLLVQAVATQAYFGALVGMPLKRHRTSAGLVTGIGNFAANLGAASSTVLVGVLAEATGGLDVMFPLLAALAGCALIAALIARRLDRSVP